MTNNVYVLKGPRRFEVEHQMLSAPLPDYVTLQYLYCGICGGDYSCYLGRRTDYPISLGHEFVAKIIDSGISRKFSTGDIVVSDFNYRCGCCRFCRKGQSHLCIHHADGYFSNRGFAQYGNVHENYLYSIPELTWLPRACLIEPLSCVIHACEMLSICARSRILIVGGGSIGSMFAFYLTRHLCCREIDIVERIEQRARNLELCFGTHISDGKSGPYDFVIDCSNEPKGTMLALKAAGCGGHICIMSHLYGLDTSFIYEEICKKELCAVFPLRNGEAVNMQAAIDLIAMHWQPFYDCLIHIYDNIESGFADKAASPWNKQVIQMTH